MASDGELTLYEDPVIGADFDEQNSLTPIFDLYDPVNYLHTGLHSDFWLALINNIFRPEMEDMLHYIYVNLGFEYPYSPGFANALTEAEFNERIMTLAKEYDYTPNYKFIEKWRESKTILLDRDYTYVPDELEKRMYEWKIWDFETYPFRRKYFGSYLGAKFAFSSIYRHGSVYLTSNYGSSPTENYLRKFRLTEDGYRSYVNGKSWYSLWSILYLEDQNGDQLPASKYPYAGEVEGLKDFIQYVVPYLKYDEGLTYDYALQDENGETYYPYKYDITKTLEYDKTIFMDLTLDRVLLHNSINYSLAEGQVCLCDVEWLEYVELYMQKAKRVSDKVFVGAQLGLVTDLSGYYAKTDRPYTHPDTRAKVITIPSAYETNKTPAYIRLGIGGSSKSSYFVNPTMVKTISSIYGSSVYGLTPIQDDVNVSSKNTADFTGLSMEYPIFESPISEFEIAPLTDLKYTIITPSVYCQEFTDVVLDNSQSIKINPASLFYPLYYTLFEMSEANVNSYYTGGTAAADYAADYAKRLTMRLPYSAVDVTFKESTLFGSTSVKVHSFTDIFNDVGNIHNTPPSPIYNDDFNSLTAFINEITTTVNLPRNFLAKGSCKFIFVISPNLLIDGIKDENKKRLAHIHRYTEDPQVGDYEYSFKVVLPDSTETEIEFDKFQFKEGLSWLFDKTEATDVFYYIEDEVNYKSNPLWQYLIIRDDFNQTTKQWSQSVKTYRHKKIDTTTGTFYELEEVNELGLPPFEYATDTFVKNTLRYTYSNINEFYGSYINIIPPYYIDSTDISNLKIRQSTSFIDYKEGTIKFIAIANPECMLYDTIWNDAQTGNIDYSDYFKLNTNGGHGASPYQSGAGIFPYNICTSIDDIDFNYFTDHKYGLDDADYLVNIVDLVTNRKQLTPPVVHVDPISWTGLSVGNFYVNTTKNFADESDKKSAIVGITELGVYNSDDRLLVYATFPPIIYNSFNHHLSANIAILEEGYLPT